MKQYQIIIVFLVLAFGLFLRLYKINSPVADWHSFRQADTMSVTKIFSQNNFDFFHPKYFDVSSTQSGKDNPQGYRMVEAPIYNTISLFFYNTFHLNIELTSRLVSIIFSLGSGLLIFLFVFNHTNLFLPSIFSLFIFMVLPFNVYYSRTILPEPTAVFFMMLSLYLFQKNIYFSGLALALSILVKPYTALILLPTILVLNKKFYKLIIFGIIAITPFLLWRLWISQYPEGIPVSNWLLNNGNTVTFPSWFHGYNLSFLNKLVALRPHWWYWLFQDRLGNLILGLYGVIPLFLGFAYRRKRIQAISLSLGFGIFLYFLIIAQGNIQHDYYQTLIIPSIAILSGLGYFYIYQILFKSYFLKISSLVLIFAISIFFSYERVIEYYKINNQNIIIAGQMVDKMVPKNAIVIAPYNGDTALLYQTNRKGYPIEVYDFDSITTKFSSTPVYFVSVNFDDYTNKIIKTYPTIYRDSQFIILQISK
ncbi:MAG: hypothetical protein WC069_02070 [Candidatus Shapirobacteria bacterium]